MADLPLHFKESIPYSPYLQHDPTVSTGDAGLWPYGFAYPLDLASDAVATSALGVRRGESVRGGRLSGSRRRSGAW